MHDPRLSCSDGHNFHARTRLSLDMSQNCKYLSQSCIERRASAFTFNKSGFWPIDC